MVLKPQTLEELARYLAEAARSGSVISGVDLRQVNSLVEHKPEDMTATVEAGMTLQAFQNQLNASGQWLPIDPANPATLTIGDLLAYNRSGPRRLGYGTIRDYLIGIKVALAGGEIIKAGGKVVKNVAGYDLCKLFIGAKHTLGIIVEATFKLRPQPEAEVTLKSSFDGLTALISATRELTESAVDPVILDAHNLSGGSQLILGFAGAREDVAYQLELAKKHAVWIETSTRYDEEFFQANPSPAMMSVLPSKIGEFLQKLKDSRFVARLGNGIIYHSGAREANIIPNHKLLQRVKATYDPKRIFPDYEL